jgi:hypothetical protein
VESATVSTAAPQLPPFWSDVTLPDGTVLAAPPPVDPVACTPTVDDVAALERTRTVDAVGGDIGAFTSTTHPTDVECQALIDQALDEVLARLPLHADPVWYPAIRRLVALRAAAMVETSYYREQSLMGGSSAAMWTDHYTVEIAALTAVIPNYTWTA